MRMPDVCFFTNESLLSQRFPLWLGGQAHFAVGLFSCEVSLKQVPPFKQIPFEHGARSKHNNINNK